MARNEKLQAIQSLRKALKSMGYYSFQIDEIIREVAGTQDLAKLTEDQLNEVAAALEETLEFAKNCMRSTKPV